MSSIPPPAEHSEVEVHFKPETGKAVIDGKTAIPFHSFVTLVLQRKVMPLLKLRGKEPVIIGSELLTSLASAPQESTENKSNLVLISIAAGVLIGIGIFAIAQIGLLILEIPFGYRELGIVAGSIGGLVLLLWLVMKMQRMPKNDKLLETMESVAGFLSKKG